MRRQTEFRFSIYRNDQAGWRGLATACLFRCRSVCMDQHGKGGLIMQRYVTVLAVLAVCTAGCSHPARLRLASSNPPLVPRVEAAAPGAAVWHLRAGLNVAALVCKGRGRVPVRGDYGRLLTRHRTLLAAAYGAERHRQGSRFDRSETQLYNRFANQHDPVQFCRDAANVVRRAVAMDSPTLALNARSLLGELR